MFLLILCIKILSEVAGALICIIPFKSAWKIQPLLEILVTKIGWVLACSCLQNFCCCSVHSSRILIKIPFLVAGSTISFFPVCKTRKHWAMNVSGNMLPRFDVLCNWLDPRSFQMKLYCLIFFSQSEGNQNACYITWSKTPFLFNKREILVSRKFTKCSLLATCNFESVCCLQDKFDHYLCSQE